MLAFSMKEVKSLDKLNSHEIPRGCIDDIKLYDPGKLTITLPRS